MLCPLRTNARKRSAFKRIIGFTAEDIEFAEDSNDFHRLCDLRLKAWPLLRIRCSSRRGRRVVKILISVPICEAIVLGLKLSCYLRFFAATLAALPSISEIPFLGSCLLIRS